MTNVSRPIHLQLRPATVASAGANGAAPPFNLSAPAAAAAAAAAGLGSPGVAILASDVGPASRPSSAGTPIRPNALMNFSASMLTAAPTTRLRPPAEAAPRVPAGCARRPQQGRQPIRSASSASQPQQSPKALSPSGAFNDSLPSQILPHLFVGNQEQTNRETVNKLNIKYILSLGLLPQLLQNNNCSVSPTSPSKMAAAASGATSKTNSNSSSTTNNTISTNNTSSANTASQRKQPSHHHHHPQQQQQQQQQLLHHHHHHHLTHLLSHQQILMPGCDESRDFKIKIRSPTAGTSHLISSAGKPAGVTHHHQRQQQRRQHNQGPASSADLYRRQASSDHDRPLPAPAATILPDNSNTDANVSDHHDEDDNDNDMDDQDDDENKRVKQVRSIHCKCINISDNSDQSLMKFFDEAFVFIDEARRKKCNILIHCLAGISRSPTIAIAYLMRAKSLHWKEAYDLVKQCRPQIDPNLNFMGQLRIYNKSLRNGRQHDERVNY